MDALPDAATAADPVPVAVVDPDDAERAELPFDDEDGPPEADEDDAEDNDEEAEEAQLHNEVAGAQAEAAAPAADVGGALPAAPVLPDNWMSLKNAELQEHLWWRKQPTSGVKAELVAKLQAAINANAPLRTPEEARDARAAGGARGPAGGGTTPRTEWEAVDASKISRPVYAGSEKLTPNSDLGLKSSTHPFTYMDAFYPKSVRDLEVENSSRYRGHVKLHAKEVYPGLPDITTRTNSLAHATLL
jgi:hypothetical protein